MNGQFQNDHVPWNKGQKMTDTYKTRISQAMLGRHASVETRAKQSAGIKAALTAPEIRAKRSKDAKTLWANPDYRNARIEQAKQRWENPEYRKKVCARRLPSSLEHALSLLLQSAEFNFTAQEPFGRYTVDAWVPDRGLVFEADGYYHISPERQETDAIRDDFLLSHGNIKAVIHLTAKDLKPWMEK